VNEDRGPADQHPEFAEQIALERNGHATPRSGCLNTFVVLWGFAFVVVGLLITGVSGYCSIVFFSAGGAGAKDFGGLLLGGVLVGLFLCGLGYIMMRRN
jgi:hypothetical protein